MESIIFKIISSSEFGAGASIALTLTIVCIVTLWKRTKKLHSEITDIYEERLKETRELTKDYQEVVDKSNKTIDMILRMFSKGNGND